MKIYPLHEDDSASEVREFSDKYWTIREFTEKKAKADIKALKRICTKMDQIKKLQDMLENEIFNLVGENVLTPMKIEKQKKEIEKKHEL